MSFSNLKSNRADVTKLAAAAKQLSGGGEKKSYGDDRIWKPTVDDSGSGYAVIRFLPAAEGMDLPWVRYWDHFFKGPTGQWYIEKSLTTLEQPDPLSELNSRLWNSGIEDNKEVARKQKRGLHYLANIMVVEDSGNPSNNGKTFIYDFGKKIFDKIMDVMQPQFPGETPMNPFDFWDGAEFKLKIRHVDGFRNYDKSEFASPTPLFDGDETRLEALYNGLYDLTEFTDPSTFKSYDELKGRLEVVLGEAVGGNAAARTAQPSTPPRPMPTASEPEVPAVNVVSGGEEEDQDVSDTMSYFSKIAADS